MPPPEIEAVARVLSAMPVPPMPIVVGEEVPDEITCMSGEHRIANSHDLWAMLLLTAMGRGDSAGNAQRKERQQELARELVRGARALQADPETAGNKEDRVYALFQDFTRGNISELSSSHDLRFAPLASIAREDRVHIAACHHAAAQDILYGRLHTDADGYEKQSAEEFGRVPYTGIMMRQFARASAAEDSEGGD